MMLVGRDAHVRVTLYKMCPSMKIFDFVTWITVYTIVVKCSKNFNIAIPREDNFESRVHVGKVPYSLHANSV